MFDLAVVIPNTLAVGPAPRPGQLGALARAGVTAILSLQEELEAAPPAPLGGRLAWARVPLADGHAGGSLRLDQLRAAVAQIRRWRDEGQMVYVHCYAGIGRSPTVCAAYLIAHEGLGLGEALARVKRARPVASPTVQQLLILAEFARQVRRSPPEPAE